MNILKFLQGLIFTYWADIVVILLFATFLCFVWFKLDKKEWVKNVLFNLVVKAEKEFGSGTGLIKYKLVMDEFYNLMPKIMKLFITRKMINYYIEKAVEELKEHLITGITLEGDYLESYNK